MLEEQGSKCGMVCNSWYKWSQGDPVVQRRCSKAEKIEFSKLYPISDYVRGCKHFFCICVYKNCELLGYVLYLFRMKRIVLLQIKKVILLLFRNFKHLKSIDLILILQ